MLSTFKKASSILIKAIGEFIAPPICDVCGRKTGDNNADYDFICLGCMDSMPFAPNPDEIYSKLIETFPNDSLHLSNAAALISLSEDEGYNNLIYNLKYHGIYKIGVELGRMLGRKLEILRFIDFDYIVPVPIHHARVRERGYNQSFYIAMGVSQILGIKYSFNIIRRNRYTQTQTTLNAADRLINLTDSIEAGGNYTEIIGKRVLLVDDVLTTGSTLNTCAGTLVEIGAKRVEAATLTVA